MTQPVKPQTIWVSSGANEPTYWERFTEQTGVDISSDTIALSFGTDVEAATMAGGWITGGNLLTQSGTTSSISGTTLHWLEAAVLIGGSNFVPVTGTWYVWAKLGANPATAVIRRGSQIVFV